MELALSVSDAVNDMSGIDPDGDLLERVPVKSTLAWLFGYHYPVHRISAKFKPEAPGEQPTFLAICRKADDDMDFLELNPVMAKLLERIESNDDKTGRELLSDLADEMGFEDKAQFIEHGKAAMQQMRDAEILIGVK